MKQEYNHDDDHEKVCRCLPGDPGKTELIHVDCASHVYPDGSYGIHDMCFRVYEKEIVALCGPNGSGKSTLLEHLNGLLLPSAGAIFVMGKKVDGGMKKDIWRYVGLIFQRPEDQLFAPTVLDDVMFGPINMGMDIDQARNVALDALEKVGAINLKDKVPDYLSGGQKRLASIAGVLAMKPRIVAMDEPTSDLDVFHSRAIEQIIKGLRDAHGISVVLAAHDLDMAARLADRVCIVRNGSVIAEGQPREVFYDRGLIEGSGLAPPSVVEIYMEYCKKRELEPSERPITTDELLDAIK